MLTKAGLKETIDLMPEKFTIDELLDMLVLTDKIERGNEQSNSGQTVSEEQLDKEMLKWFK